MVTTGASSQEKGVEFFEKREPSRVPAHLVQREDAAGVPGDVDTSSSSLSVPGNRRGSSTAAALGGERGNGVSSSGWFSDEDFRHLSQRDRADGLLSPSQLFVYHAQAGTYFARGPGGCLSWTASPH